MNLVVEASLSFFLNKKTNEPFNRIYNNGLIVDFTIRSDMFNCGRIEFTEKQTVVSGDSDVKATITFLYEELVLPFLKEGHTFTFGEPSNPYGKGIVTKIIINT